MAGFGTPNGATTGAPGVKLGLANPIGEAMGTTGCLGRPPTERGGEGREALTVAGTDNTAGAAGAAGAGKGVGIGDVVMGRAAGIETLAKD